MHSKRVLGSLNVALSVMAYWYTWWNRAILNKIRLTYAFHTVTSQNSCREKSVRAASAVGWVIAEPQAHIVLMHICTYFWQRVSSQNFMVQWGAHAPSDPMSLHHRADMWCKHWCKHCFPLLRLPDFQLIEYLDVISQWQLIAVWSCRYIIIQEASSFLFIKPAKKQEVKPPQWERSGTDQWFQSHWN